MTKYPKYTIVKYILLIFSLLFIYFHKSDVKETVKKILIFLDAFGHV